MSVSFKQKKLSKRKRAKSWWARVEVKRSRHCLLNRCRLTYAREKIKFHNNLSLRRLLMHNLKERIFAMGGLSWINCRSESPNVNQSREKFVTPNDCSVAGQQFNGITRRRVVSSDSSKLVASDRVSDCATVSSSSLILKLISFRTTSWLLAQLFYAASTDQKFCFLIRILSQASNAKRKALAEYRESSLVIVQRRRFVTAVSSDELALAPMELLIVVPLYSCAFWYHASHWTSTNFNFLLLFSWLSNSKTSLDLLQCHRVHRLFLEIT